MPTKKGAGGRNQNYDPHTGRYAKTTFEQLLSLTKTKIVKTKAEKEKERLEYLINCAKSKGDSYVLEALLYIEKELPHSVIGVNCYRYDPNIKKMREFDIITQHHIIEVKSGVAKRKLTQLIEQKEYASSINKKHILYAPGIAKIVKFDYNKKGINVVSTKEDLIKILKEK